MTDKRLVKIGVLRKNEDDLSAEERELLIAAFPEDEVGFVAMHSQDCEHHAGLCNMLAIGYVLLPKDRPIQDKAMREGVVHVAVINGKLMQLLPMTPEFVPFDPNESGEKLDAADVASLTRVTDAVRFYANFIKELGHRVDGTALCSIIYDMLSSYERHDFLKRCRARGLPVPAWE